LVENRWQRRWLAFLASGGRIKEVDYFEHASGQVAGRKKKKEKKEKKEKGKNRGRD
jgi:hypothetical protein